MYAKDVAKVAGAGYMRRLPLAISISGGERYMNPTAHVLIHGPCA
jgi:hypothetical protein